MATAVTLVPSLAFRSSLMALLVFRLACDAVAVACETFNDMAMLARLPREKASEPGRFRVST
jgi:hypothetical protein